MPLQETSGAASYDAYGGGVAAVPNYIEDVFSTYLYTGNGSTQTINNGIDLAGKGGLVWIKSRSNAWSNQIFDTAQGAPYVLVSNTTAATAANFDLSSFSSTGFNLGSGTGNANGSGATFTSWTFRKQPKFFDVVTYTGNGGTLSVSHSLASKPGCIIIKRTDSTGDWLVCTRKNDGNIYAMYLNQTAGQFYDGTEGSLWSSTAVSINWINSNVAAGYNDSGATYVMYVLAHNAGGFGLTGTDNVISCGSYVTTGNDNINLGYEPQLIIEHRVNGSSDWHMWDTMRGMSQTSLYELEANTSAAEYSFGGGYVKPTATGYNNTYWSAGQTVIYIAIRRGPMKTPTTGTSVFTPVTRAGTGAAATVSSVGFPPDLTTLKVRNGGSQYNFVDRLRGREVVYSSTTLAAIALNSGYDTAMDSNTGFYFVGPPENVDCNYGGLNDVYHNFRRAPGFFDEVCYTGTGSATTQTHNLGVVPELIIGKDRTQPFNWLVYSAALGNTKAMYLNTNDAPVTGTYLWNNTSPTSTTFALGAGGLNVSGDSFVAYLFASCPGVSKVGTYTGNGSSQTINCGFTGGARFVLIKRTDSTGDWYVYDTARGMTTLVDPYLLLNSTAAESATLGSVTTVSGGFALNASILSAINTNGASYIFLAIA